MEQTNQYNEICYLIDGLPFFPIGIICEDEITKEEVAFAQMLNLKIFFRCSNNLKSYEPHYEEKVLKKSYYANPDHYNYYH